MIIVADSGPLHYLILLDQADLLRRFYGRVCVPEAVAAELSAVGAPRIVRDWISGPPSWVEVNNSKQILAGRRSASRSSRP